MAEKIFNVTRDNNGKVIGIEFNAEAFIIPNHSGKLEDFWSSSARDRTKEMATNLLGKEPDDTERYIQMWYTSDDIHCENLADHYPYVEIDGKKYLITIITSYLPYSVLTGKDDGDVIDISFMNGKSWGEVDDEDPVRITMHVKLNQLGYRYRNFGSFSSVLQKVL